MKTIVIKARERKRIIHRFSNSVAAIYSFSTEAVRTGEPVSGDVEIKGSRWLFPKPPVIQALNHQNSVEKGMWDTFYSVYVVPDNDVKVTLNSADHKHLWVYMAMAFVIVAMATGIVLMSAG